MQILIYGEPNVLKRFTISSVISSQYHLLNYELQLLTELAKKEFVPVALP